MLSDQIEICQKMLLAISGISKHDQDKVGKFYMRQVLDKAIKDHHNAKDENVRKEV
jgi:hypothetical protein